PIAGGPCGSPPFLRKAYAVLAPLSRRYPPLRDTFRCITHPFAARRQGCPRAAARLACVKHAASVQSEPGSNSSVDLGNYYFQSKTHSNAHPEGWTRAIQRITKTRQTARTLSSCEHQLVKSPPSARTRFAGTTNGTHTYRLRVFKERPPAA